jgi:hypothetical protein
MGIRINDQGGGDPHTQNPPPEHDMAGGGACSSSTVVADVPTAPMEAPDVLRGAMMCASLSMPQEFADPVISAPLASSASTPACDTSGVAAESADVAAPTGPLAMSVADDVTAASAVAGADLRISAGGAAGAAWSLHDTGAKYNVGTAEEPIMRKVAPRMAPSAPTTQQQIDHEMKLHFGGD